MKKIVLLLILIISFSGFSQIHDPVKWSTSVKKISNSEYELIVTAIIENGWHLYSQTVPKDGPIATTFIYKTDKNYLKKGNTKEGKGYTVDDKVFNMRIKYFEKKAYFKQRIKVKSNNKFTVNGIVEFMVCNDVSCLAPKEVDLEFKIN